MMPATNSVWFVPAVFGMVFGGAIAIALVCVRLFNIQPPYHGPPPAPPRPPTRKA